MTTEISPCCLRAFEWNGTPIGTTTTLANRQCYTTGTNPSISIFIIHDLLGWTFPNVRLLADHYAREVNATVYVPDFFGGEVLSHELILAGRWAELDLPSFLSRNSRAIREPEIFAFAKALRAKHGKVGAVGFCYGGWAVHRLAAGEFANVDGKGLVDCATAGHPSLLTVEDIESVKMPMQILAPERDGAFTMELKMRSWEAMQRNGVPFEYVHFPGVEHACLVRGDEGIKGEREAMVRGMDAVVGWMRFWLMKE
ncbi:hypothetical protein OQA88_10799 [Cercophora sp. LCS_1]